MTIIYNLLKEIKKKNENRKRKKLSPTPYLVHIHSGQIISEIMVVHNTLKETDDYDEDFRQNKDTVYRQPITLISFINGFSHKKVYDVLLVT